MEGTPDLRGRPGSVVPFQSDPFDQSRAPQPWEHIMNKRTILVVDDDKNLLHGLAVHLEANDYAVLLATNVNIAVNTARRKHVDFIVLDMELPDGEGFDVLERLKIELPENRYRVILLSSREESALRAARPLEADVFAYFQKPVDIYSVLDAVKKAVPPGVVYAV